MPYPKLIPDFLINRIGCKLAHSAHQISADDTGGAYRRENEKNIKKRP
jgi:hypothetical protein